MSSFPLPPLSEGLALSGPCQAPCPLQCGLGHHIHGMQEAVSPQPSVCSASTRGLWLMGKGHSTQPGPGWARRPVHTEAGRRAEQFPHPSPPGPVSELGDAGIFSLRWG